MMERSLAAAFSLCWRPGTILLRKVSACPPTACMSVPPFNSTTPVQYKANYSMGGKLTPDTIDDFVSAAASLGAAKDSSDTYTPPAAKTPGYPMWGRDAGCAFLTGAPRTAWPARYKCEKANTYSCTSDYRMSAVCVIKADYQGEPAAASYSIDINTGSTAASLYNDANRGVPPTFRYFTTDAEAVAATGISGATAARTGGYSSAQDYIPVPVGYWACNAASANNVSAGVDGTGSGLSNFAGLFGVSTSTEMDQFGGQARCPNCRCMQSSLLELTRSLTPAVSSYGLCYRTNCYRPDYLQVAIRGQFGKNKAYW